MGLLSEPLGFALKANWNEVFCLTFRTEIAYIFESEDFPNNCECVIYQDVPFFVFKVFRRLERWPIG